jgi:hypothetical protein
MFYQVDESTAICLDRTPGIYTPPGVLAGQGAAIVRMLLTLAQSAEALGTGVDFAVLLSRTARSALFLSATMSASRSRNSIAGGARR